MLKAHSSDAYKLLQKQAECMYVHIKGSFLGVRVQPGELRHDSILKLIPFIKESPCTPLDIYIYNLQDLSNVRCYL